MDIFKEDKIPINRETEGIRADDERGAVGESQDYQKREEAMPPRVSVYNFIIKYSLYILAFATPLFFLPFTSQALDYNKQLLLVFFSIIALVAWLAKIVKMGRLTWKRNFANVFVWVFLASYGVATYFSLSKTGSFFGFLNHLSLSFLSVIGFAIVYFLVANYKTKDVSADNKKSAVSLQERIALFMVYGITAAGVIGLLQLFKVFVFPWDFAKVATFNTIGTFNSLALLLAVGVVLGLGFLRRGVTNEKRGANLSLFMKIATVFMFTVMVLVNFWVAWLALVVGIISLLIFSAEKKQDILTGRKVFSLTIMILILSVIFWQFNFVYDIIPVSANIPIEVYPTFTSSFEVIKGVVQDRLLFGSGPETFVFDWSRYKPQSVNLSSLWYVRFNSPTAWWTNILANGGIISFLAISFFIIYLLYKTARAIISKKSNYLMAGLISAFLVLVVGRIFYASNMTLNFYFWILAGLLVAFLSSSEMKKARFKVNLDNFPRVSLTVSFVLIFVIISGFALLFLKSQHYAAEVNYKKSLTALAEGKSWDTTISYMAKAVRMNKYQDVYLRELSRMSAQRANEEIEAVNQGEKEISEAGPKIQAFASNAVNAAKAATDLSPNDVANWIQRARAYDAVFGYISGASDWSVKSWKRAAELEPTNPYIHSQLGVAYLVKADVALQSKDEELRKEMIMEAEKSFKKAVEMKENYAPAHYQLALLYEKQGNIKDAIRKLETTVGVSPQDPGLAFRLGLMYLRTNQADKAKGIFVRAIQIFPDYSNAMWYLALILESEGDFDNAVKLMEKVYDLNSQNEDIRAKLEALRAGQAAVGAPGEQPPLGQELEERP